MSPWQTFQDQILNIKRIASLDLIGSSCIYWDWRLKENLNIIVNCIPFSVLSENLLFLLHMSPLVPITPISLPLPLMCFPTKFAGRYEKFSSFAICFATSKSFTMTNLSGKNAQQVWNIARTICLTVHRIMFQYAYWLNFLSLPFQSENLSVNGLIPLFIG